MPFFLTPASSVMITSRKALQQVRFIKQRQTMAIVAVFKSGLSGRCSPRTGPGKLGHPFDGDLFLRFNTVQ
jgi:hypothetical protein